MRRDPLIIGAGPAGIAAAITLARAGHTPILLEKTTGPTDKVCGDFLSADTIHHAQFLGVDPTTLGATPIRRVRIVAGNRVAESILPFPALGLSRRALDTALLRQAETAGALVRGGQTVRSLTRDGAAWTIRTDVARTAETVFLATGKHDLRDFPRQHTSRDCIGLKMYLALASGPSESLASTTELTLFPGGYAGLQHVENGRTVLCIAIGRAEFQRCGGSWPHLLATIRQRNPHFAAMLHDARCLLPRPLAIAGIPYGYHAEPDSLFRLGDQAAVIPSLTGDGMAIALYSGQQAAQAWLVGHHASDYQRALKRTLAPQMRLARVLHRAGTKRLSLAVTIPAIRLLPSLLGWAASQTRLPPSVAAQTTIIPMPKPLRTRRGP